jgi:hypothetical protein
MAGLLRCRHYRPRRAGLSELEAVLAQPHPEEHPILDRAAETVAVAEVVAAS